MVDVAGVDHDDGGIGFAVDDDDVDDIDVDDGGGVVVVDDGVVFVADAVGVDDDDVLGDVVAVVPLALTLYLRGGAFHHSHLFLAVRGNFTSCF